MSEELKGPFPDRSPYGEIGRTGSPDAYLIDPGAGSASDRVTRFWPQREQLDDIHRRGGSIIALYALRTPDAAHDAVLEEAARVFDEDIVEQSKRLGLPSSTKESPGQWMMRVRREAILALKGPKP